MSRKAPLFNPDDAIDNLVVRNLSPMTKLFYMLLTALANKGGTGYFLKWDEVISIEEAAKEVGFDGDLGGPVKELIRARLLCEDETGFYITEVKIAAEQREKKRRAGSKGGNATTMRRADTSETAKQKAGSSIRSSGCSSNVISFEKSGTYDKADKKEKRTKKEKNNNYIYILGKKVFTGDQGSEKNRVWFDGMNFKIHKRLWMAFLEAFPNISEDDFYNHFNRQDNWLEAQSDGARDNWLALTIAYFRKINNDRANTLELAV